MNITRMSDLAVENFGFAAPLHSSSVTETVRGGFSVLHAELDGGEYHTIISGKIWQDSVNERKSLMQAAAEILRRKIRSSGRILFCGVGNPAIPSDSLGPRTAERIVVTGEDHRPSVFAILPGTPSHTGIDTADYLRCIAEMIAPDTIILVDSLSAKSRERLQSVIQIADSLTPGSALSHTSGEISARTMPCQVISIGVPTVISTAVFGDTSDEPLLVARAESDIITDCYASIIGGAINTAVFGK